MELLIGAGNNKIKKLHAEGRESWTDLVTLDIDPGTNPDVVHDIGKFPLPFDNDMFHEIHAYDVLEHCGTQGDWRFFFAQWDEFWRILKPDGLFIGMSPSPESGWAFGDPGHTRVMSPWNFYFLNRANYGEVGKTAMTDYRPFFVCDFTTEHLQQPSDGQMHFVLKTVKPAR